MEIWPGLFQRYCYSVLLFGCCSSNTSTWNTNLNTSLCLKVCCASEDRETRVYVAVPLGWKSVTSSRVDMHFSRAVSSEATIMLHSCLILHYLSVTVLGVRWERVPWHCGRRWGYCSLPAPKDKRNIGGIIICRGKPKYLEKNTS
jgi:hypothetical protein